MKIGLVRHFKVQLSYPKKFLISAEELVQFFEEYDSAEIAYKNTNMQGIAWKRCFASPAARAAKTANAIYPGAFTTAVELHELNVLSLVQKNRPRPLFLWALKIRSVSLSSNETTDAFKQRLFTFLDRILAENNEDVLLVSHGFVMMFLQKELRKRGFTGPGFRLPENGKVYVYEI